MKAPLEVLWCQTNGKADFVTIPHTLDELQALVGGYLEPLGLGMSIARPGLLALANEEGLLKELPPNPYSFGLLAPVTAARRLLVGDVVVLRSEGAEFASLTENDKHFLKEVLARTDLPADSPKNQPERPKQTEKTPEGMIPS